METTIDKPDVISIRSIRYKNSEYLRLEDVAAFLNQLASSEETDTRNRLCMAALNLQRGCFELTRND